MWFDELEPGSAGIVYGKVVSFIGIDTMGNWNYTARDLGGDDSGWIQIEYEDCDLNPDIEIPAGWQRTRALPSAITTCREAFSVASRSWLSVSSFGTIEDNYYDPERDFLVLNSFSLGFSYQNVSCLLREDRENVLKVAVLGSDRTPPTPQEYRDLYFILACFGNVKELFLLHYDPDQEPSTLKGEVHIRFHDPVEKGWPTDNTKIKFRSFGGDCKPPGRTTIEGLKDAKFTTIFTLINICHLHGLCQKSLNS